jgi:hypothetical protein
LGLKKRLRVNTSNMGQSKRVNVQLKVTTGLVGGILKGSFWLCGIAFRKEEHPMVKFLRLVMATTLGNIISDVFLKQLVGL